MHVELQNLTRHPLIKFYRSRLCWSTKKRKGYAIDTPKTQKTPDHLPMIGGSYLPTWWSWRELNSWPLECHTLATGQKPNSTNELSLLTVYSPSVLIHFDIFCISQSDFMGKDFQHFLVLNAQVTHGDARGWMVAGPHSPPTQPRWSIGMVWAQQHKILRGLWLQAHIARNSGFFCQCVMGSLAVNSWRMPNRNMACRLSIFRFWVAGDLFVNRAAKHPTACSLAGAATRRL